MDGLKDLPKKLPETSDVWDIDVVGETTGKRFLGEFTSKIPNLRDQSLSAKHKAYLNGDMVQYLDITTLRLHHMISYLRYALEKTPKFWSEADHGYQLMDLNVIEAVYDKALNFEEAWLKQIWGEENVEERKRKQNE